MGNCPRPAFSEGFVGKRGQKNKRSAAKKPAEREHIFIGIPCVGDDMHIALLHFLTAIDGVNKNEAAPWKFSWTVKSGLRPVEFARNRIVGEFLKTDANRLFFIDADMIPGTESLQLLHVDADIVSGAAFAFKRSQGGGQPRLELCSYKYNVRGDNKFNSIIPGPGASVLDIDGCGTACMVIRRKVLEDPAMRLAPNYEWYSNEYNVEDEHDGEAPAIFQTHYKPNGEILRGEDLDFCYRAKNAGYSLKLHAGVDFGHVKPMNLSEVGRMMHDTAVRTMEQMRNGNQGQVHRQVEPAARADRGVRLGGLESIRRVMDGAGSVRAGREEARKEAAEEQSRRGAAPNEGVQQPQL